MEQDPAAELSFDFFPGMLFQRSPRFTCGEFIDEPALNLGGLTTKALKQVAQRFPETRSLCRRYDWTLRASYLALFVGPSLSAIGWVILDDRSASHELRVALLLGGLALLGLSLLLNKDTGGQLRQFVATYNALARAEKIAHQKARGVT